MSIALTAYDARLTQLDWRGRQHHNPFSRRPARVLGTLHMEYIMSPSPVPQVSLTTVATFPKNYFLENLAVRADNSVLVTALNHKELWYVPSSLDGAEVTPRLLFTFPHLAMGIVEAEPDIFYSNVRDIHVGCIGPLPSRFERLDSWQACSSRSNSAFSAAGSRPQR
jgi:hypothetical protein